MHNLKRVLHEMDRDAKRESARDRSRRLTAIADDLLHDGIEEVVVSHFDAEERALPRDCEAEAYAMNAEWEAPEEPLMADWEVALLTGIDQDECQTIAWSSVNYDYEKEVERSIANERFRLSLEAEQDAEDALWDDSPDVWPPPATMHDIEENHDYFSRGFTITTRP